MGRWAGVAFHAALIVGAAWLFGHPWIGLMLAASWAAAVSLDHEQPYEMSGFLRHRVIEDGDKYALQEWDNGRWLTVERFQDTAEIEEWCATGEAVTRDQRAALERFRSGLR